MTTQVMNDPVMGRPVTGKEKGGLAGIIQAVLGALGSNPFANAFFFLAVVIGFLHGWLQMRFPSPAMTFAYDIPMTLALLFVLLKLKRKENLFPSSRVSTAIQLLLALSVLYGLLPFGVPWLARLSSLRGWCFAPMMMLLGYHLIRSVRQLEVFVWLMILLGTATAVYGVFFQSEAEIRSMMATDEAMSARLVGTFYAGSQGSTFRHFSTYVTAAVFGSVMALCTTFATSRILVPGATILERTILVLCASMCSYALVLTGSRTSMLLLILGVTLSAVFSRGGGRFLLLPILLLVPLAGGMLLVGGAATERFGELLSPANIWSRVYIVLSPGTQLRDGRRHRPGDVGLRVAGVDGVRGPAVFGRGGFNPLDVAVAGLEPLRHRGAGGVDVPVGIGADLHGFAVPGDSGRDAGLDPVRRVASSGGGVRAQGGDRR